MEAPVAKQPERPKPLVEETLTPKPIERPKPEVREEEKPRVWTDEDILIASGIDPAKLTPVQKEQELAKIERTIESKKEATGTEQKLDEVRQKLQQMAEHGKSTPQEQIEIQALIDSTKRPYTVEDIRDVLQGFREFESARKAEGASWTVGGEGSFYRYLSSGEFLPGVSKPEKTATPEPVSSQDYDSLLISVYTLWRKNLIVNRDGIAQARPEVIRKLGNLENLPEAHTGEEVRELYRKIPALNDLSAASYQEGLSEEFIDNPFLHFQGHRLNGYRQQKPETQMRIYLNPPAEALPLLARAFIDTAQAEGVPFYFKLIDFSQKGGQLPEVLNRSDRMVFYTDRETAARVIRILQKLQGEHPEWFEGRELPALTAKIAEGIGIAEEPTKDQHQRFSYLGKDKTSFNEVRARFLSDVWIGATREVILLNRDWRPRGGRTFREIFNDNIPPEDRQYVDQLWSRDLNAEGLDSKARSVLRGALQRTMADVLPGVTPESLLLFIDRQIRLKAAEYVINPDNIAVNAS